MKKITIIGLGVVGGSFAQAFKETFGDMIQICAIDTDAKTIQYALNKKWIDCGATENQNFLETSDLVLFALYPTAIKKFLIENPIHYQDGTILTDVTGVKRLVIQEVLPYVPSNVDFIFGHPMAGREKKGIHYASSAVFKNANYILTPLPHNQAQNITVLTQLLSQIGFKRVTSVSPEKHDEMIAYTSQLTHLLSVALINSDLEERETEKFVGDSFRELTRIANINEQLWAELFIENKDILIETIEAFETQLNLLKDGITNSDYTSLHQLLQQSAKRRIAFEQHDNARKEQQ